MDKRHQKFKDAVLTVYPKAGVFVSFNRYHVYESIVHNHPEYPAYRNVIATGTSEDLAWLIVYYQIHNGDHNFSSFFPDTILLRYAFVTAWMGLFRPIGTSGR